MDPGSSSSIESLMNQYTQCVVKEENNILKNKIFKDLTDKILSIRNTLDANHSLKDLLNDFKGKISQIKSDDIAVEFINIIEKANNLDVLMNQYEQCVIKENSGTVEQQADNKILKNIIFEIFTNKILSSRQALTADHPHLLKTFKSNISERKSDDKIVKFINIIETTNNIDVLLKQYGNYLAKPNLRQIKEKKILASRLMNYVVSLGETLSKRPEQQQLLLDFYKKYSQTDSNAIDIVIQFIKALSDDSFTIVLEETQHTVNKFLEGMPDDIKILAETFNKNIIAEFAFITDANIKRQIVSIVIDRINDATTAEELDYEYLAHFANIIMQCWKEPYVQIKHDEIAQNHRLLITKIGQSDNADAQLFKTVATEIVMLYDTTHPPDDLLQIEAYHGKALELGHATLLDMLKKIKQSVEDESKLKFAIQFDTDKLDPGEFLIRNSSTVASTDSKGVHYYPLTLDRKDRHGIIHSKRITRINNNNVVTWKFIDDQSKDPVIFTNLDDAIKAWLKDEYNNYKPKKFLTTEEMHEYLTKTYIPRLLG